MKYAVRKISTVAFGEMKDFFEETQYSEFFSTSFNLEFAVFKISRQVPNISEKVTNV